MKGAPSFTRHTTGFTLVEMLVSIAAAGALMASIVASSVALQRSFFWSANYSEQSLAQLRALDFVTRDVRRASGVYVLSMGQVLTLEIPDAYASYDAQGNPTSAPVSPTIIRGKPEYGDPTQPLVVTYYLNGATLLRQQFVSATAQNSELVVATGIRSFQTEIVGGGNLVKTRVTFRPRLRPDTMEATTEMSALAAARPIRLKYEDAGIP
jgi:prepilin-type N-terminal cleavage/methylation domain-containing protein